MVRISALAAATAALVLPLTACSGTGSTGSDGTSAAQQDRILATNEVAQSVEVPLDGGSFTWPSGVTMKVTVDRVERWGTYSDYCGDGSCGVSHPDDTRLVIRYTIGVPVGFGREFDATGCPGELHSLNENDEDALISVAGTFAKSLDGVRPGGTKYGAVEYSIAKAFVGEQFYITSDCGSVFPMSDADFAALSDDERSQVLSDFESQPQEVTFAGTIPTRVLSR